MVLRGEDFDMVAGDDANLEITVKEADVNGVLQLVDLQGATITWVLKDREDSAVALITKTTAIVTEIEILNQTTYKGKCVVYLDPADTAALASGTYFHGMKVLDMALDTHTVTEGYISLQPKLV